MKYQIAMLEFRISIFNNLVNKNASIVFWDENKIWMLKKKKAHSFFFWVGLHF